MLVKERNKFKELQKSATVHLDQMDHAFSTIRNFSKMFDSYVVTIQELVTNLLEADSDTLTLDAKKTIKNVQFTSFRRNSQENPYKRSSFDVADARAVRARIGACKEMSEAHIESNVFGAPSFPGETYDNNLKRRTTNSVSNNEATSDNGLLSALQMQNMTISKIIDAGEQNSKNLRDVLERMCNDRASEKDADCFKIKIKQLKSKIKDLKFENENRLKENQQLRVEMAVSQGIKKEMDSIRDSLKRENEGKAESQRAVSQRCKNCDSLRVENTTLMANLDFTSQRVLTLNNQIVSMQQEFIVLFTTAQDIMSALKNRADTYDAHDEGLMFESNGRSKKALVDSNYNTILNRLGNIEAGFNSQNYASRAEPQNYKPCDYTSISREQNNNNYQPSSYNSNNAIDFKYSRFETDERPSKVRQQDEDANLLFSCTREPKDSNLFLQTLPEFSRNYLPDSTSIDQTINEQFDETPFIGISPIKQESMVPNTMKTADTKIKTQNQTQNSFHLNLTKFERRCETESEEKYSIVEMTDSSQYSMHSDKNPFNLINNKDKNSIVRISFSKNANLIHHSWADPRTSSDCRQGFSADKQRLSSRSGQNDDYRRLEVSQDVEEQFYTFSNRQEDSINLSFL